MVAMLTILLLFTLSEQYCCLLYFPDEQQNAPYRFACVSIALCYVLLLQVVPPEATSGIADTTRHMANLCMLSCALDFIFLHALGGMSLVLHIDCASIADPSTLHINLAPQVLVRPWHSGASSDSIKDSGCHPSILDAFPRPQAYMTECESPRTSK